MECQKINNNYFLKNFKNKFFLKMDKKELQDIYKIIEKQTYYPLSGDDMLKLTQGQADLIMYNQLKLFSN